jgi:hypothetical protein
VTGPPPVKRRSLTVAGVVFAATARAPCYLVSRSMTSNATSKVMASAYIASGIATPFSGGTTPELSGEEMHPQHPTSHKSMLGFAWDGTLEWEPIPPRERVSSAREVSWGRATHLT